MPTCEEGTWGCDFYSVGPQPGERVVVKHRYSAFRGTDLDLILRARGVRTVLICGVATNVCVETSAREAYMHDYEVVFLADCSAAYSQAEHDATLYNMAQHFGVVAREEEVCSAWATTAVAR